MATDWAAQANEMFKAWSEGQKAWLESFARSPGAFVPPGMGAPPWAGAFGGGLPGVGAPGTAGTDSPGVAFAHAEGVREAARQLNDAWKASIEQWMGLLQQGTRFTASQEHLRKIFDPAEWAKPAPGSFDFGIERIIEGPNFATLWDLDRKLMKLQQLGLRRTEDSAAYHAVVFAAWNRAVERFTRELVDRAGPPLGSFRDLIDLWIKTANDTLIDVHRSPEFLEAQRRVTRSATDYRLAEREIAEAWCELHHIPTRTEVDEIARAVHELRRDVRALLRKVGTTATETRTARGAVHAGERGATRDDAAASNGSAPKPARPRAARRKPGPTGATTP